MAKFVEYDQHAQGNDKSNDRERKCHANAMEWRERGREGMPWLMVAGAFPGSAVSGTLHQRCQPLMRGFACHMVCCQNIFQGANVLVADRLHDLLDHDWNRGKRHAALEK